VDSKAWTNSISMEFVLIPAGTFMMGSLDSDTEANENEKPAHRVTISQPFYLGKYPVTQAQWEAVMDNNPSRFKASNRLVDSVSWADAANQLITRWDNTPHFPDLPGFPDHIHNGATGEVMPGQPMSIFAVLDAIADRIR
jgi:hypothetical protein